MAAYALDPPVIAMQLQAANRQSDTGAFNRNDESYLVETGSFLTSVEAVENLVVGMHQGSPVYLKQGVTVTGGPAEPEKYVSFLRRRHVAPRQCGAGRHAVRRYGIRRQAGRPRRRDDRRAVARQDGDAGADARAR